MENWEVDFTWQPNYNIAPTQKILVLTCENKRTIKGMYWGLVPNWSKKHNISNRMINARMETLIEKPSYASLVRSQRCIVIADGYYEWMQTSQGKQPYYIHDPGNIILPFAGLWDRWQNVGKQERMTCTIITTEPNKELKQIHNRMPVILTRERMDEWIDCRHNNKVLQLLKPYTKDLDYYPVSTLVNYAVNNSQKCIDPIIMEE